MAWRKLTPEKSLYELSPSKITLGDFMWLGGKIIPWGMQLGGIVYAFTPTEISGNENHIRDGLLLFATGKILDEAQDIGLYIREIYRNHKE